MASAGAKDAARAEHQDEQGKEGVACKGRKIMGYDPLGTGVIGH